MNRDDNYEPEIDLQDLFWHVLIHWRIILVMMIIGGMLGGWYSLHIGGSIGTKQSEMAIEEDLEEAELLHAAASEAIGYDVEYYEQSLATEREYLENSLYMKLNPASVAYTNVDYSITLNDPGNEKYTDLILLGHAFERAVYDKAFLEEQAKKYNTDPQYIQELISVLRLKEATSFTGSIGEQEMTFKEASTYAFMVTVSGEDTDFTSAIIDDMTEYLKAYAVERLSETNSTRISFSFNAEQPISAIAVNSNINNNQFNYRTNIYNDIYRLAQIYTSRDTIAKNMITEDAEVEQLSVSKKHIIAGLVGGMVLAVLLLAVLYLYGGKLKSEADVQRRLGIRVLGLFPEKADMEKHRLRVDRFFWKRANGIVADLTDEQALEIIQSNIRTLSDVNAKIMLTCTVEDDSIKNIALNLVQRIHKSKEGFCVEYYPAFLQSPKAYDALSETDSIILLEKRGESRIREMEVVIEKLQLLKKTILGVIIA